MNMTDFSLEGINLSFTTGKGTLEGLRIGNPPEFQTPRALYLERAAFTVDPATVWKEIIRIEEIHLTGLNLTYERGQGSDNLKVLVQGLTEKMDSLSGCGEGNPSVQGRRFVIKEFVLTGTRVYVSASLFKGKSLRIRLPDICLAHVGGEDGVPVSELAGIVLSEVHIQVVGAVKKRLGDMGRDVYKSFENIGSKFASWKDSFRKKS